MTEKNIYRLRAEEEEVMEIWNKRGYDDALMDAESASYEQLAAIVEFTEGVHKATDLLHKNGKWFTKYFEITELLDRVEEIAKEDPSFDEVAASHYHLGYISGMREILNKVRDKAKC